MILSILFALTAQADSTLCRKQQANEPLIYMSEFKWGQSLAAMKEKSEQIYKSGKRLKGRAFYDELTKGYVIELDSGRVRLTNEFIRNVTRHIEINLERRYADFVFFPDMGHSHLYIPEKDWEELDKIPPSERHTLYEKMLALPSLQMLYHTAEQLAVKEGERGEGAFPQDKILLWRYFSRNPVGDNTTGENVAPRFAFNNNSYNTVHELAGYHSWSAGYTLSASKDGCFSFKAPDGQEFRFDISLEDLPYSPVDGGGGGDIGRFRDRQFGHAPRRR